MTDVGDGDIAFEPFFCHLGTNDHHYIVERDTATDAVANPAGSFATAERSSVYPASLREARPERGAEGQRTTRNARRPRRSP